MAEMVDSQLNVLPVLTPAGVVPPSAPSVVQQGQMAYRAELANSQSVSAENARLEEKMGMRTPVQDPSKPPEPTAQEAAVKKFAESPAKTGAAAADGQPPAAPVEPPTLKPMTPDQKNESMQRTLLQNTVAKGPMAGTLVGGLRVAEGFINTSTSIINFLHKMSASTGEQVTQIPPTTIFSDLKLSTDPVTRTSAAFAQYVAPWMAAGPIAAAGAEAVGLGKVGEFATRLATSGAINAFIQDPDGDKFLAKMGELFPALANPLSDWLAAPNDSAAEGHFKSFVDGMVPDVLMAGAVKALAGSYAAIKAGVGQVDKIIPLSSLARDEKALVEGQVKEVVAKGVPAEATVSQAAEIPAIKASLEYNAAHDAKAREQLLGPLEGDINPATIAGAQHRDSNVIMQAAQDFIERAGVSELRSSTRGVITMSEMDQLATDVLLDTEGFTNLIKGYKPGDVVKPEQLRAVQLFTADLFQQSLDADVRAIQSGLATDIAYAEQKFAETATVARVALGGASEYGRGLGLLSKMAEMPSGAKLQSALKQIEAMGGINKGLLRLEQRKAMRELLQESTPSKLMSAIGRVGVNTVDAMNYVMLTGMISGPKTSVRNFVSAVGRQVINVTADSTTRVLGAIPGAPAGWQQAAAVANARMAGFWGSYRAGMQQALHTAESGETFIPAIFDFSTKPASPLEAATAAQTPTGALNKYLSTVTKFSSATGDKLKGINDAITMRPIQISDSLNGMVASHREIIGDAALEGLNAGLQAGSPEMEQLIALRLKNPTPETWIKAQNAAKESSMNLAYRDLFKGHAIGEAVGTAFTYGDAAFAALRLTPAVAFMKAGANEIVQSMEVTPLLGLATPRVYNAVLRGTPVQRAEAIAKQLAGAQIMAGSYMTLSYSGFELTGSGPTDVDTLRALKASNPGWQPYSIKTPGGKYYNFKDFGQISHLLQVMGDFWETHALMPEATAGKYMTATLSHLAESYEPTQLTQNIPKFFEAMHELGPNAEGSKLLALATQYAGALVPMSGLMRGITQTVDPAKRQTFDVTSSWNTIKNTMQSEIPGWSALLPPQRNIYGEVVAYPTGFGPAIASPFYTSEGDDKLSKELMRLGVYNTELNEPPPGATSLKLTMPPKVLTFPLGMGAVGKIELNPIQYDRLVQYSAGLNIPAKTFDSSGAMNSADINSSERQRLLEDYSVQGGIMPLKQMLNDTLARHQTGTFKTQLQADEFARAQVKQVLSDYRKMGKAAMYFDTQNLQEMQQQIQQRVKVLRGQ